MMSGVTAFAGADNVRQSLEAGFDAHLAKPVDAVDLSHLVAKLTVTFKGVMLAVVYEESDKTRYPGVRGPFTRGIHRFKFSPGRCSRSRLFSLQMASISSV